MLRSKAFGALEIQSGECAVSVLSFDDIGDNQKIILIEELATKENEELSIAFKCYIYRVGSQACIHYLESDNRFITFEELLLRLPAHSSLAHRTGFPCNEILLQQMLERFKEPQYVTQDRWVMPYLRMLGPCFMREDTFYVYDAPPKPCLFPCCAAFFKKACTPTVAISTISCVAFLFLIIYLQSNCNTNDLFIFNESGSKNSF